MTLTSTQVLVVGAGPSGIVLASELRRHGVEVRLIERLLVRTDQSRATDLQPRSLELLEGCGALPYVRARGFEVHAINIYSGVRRICRMAFAGLDTPHPHMLASSQSNTERGLAEHHHAAGGSIERGVELVALAQDDAGVTCTLRHADGREEQVRSAYVVGCDGAHSTVRNLLGLAFVGDSYPEHHLLADARVTWDVAKDELHGFVGRDGHLLVLALPEPDTYRLFFDIPPDDPREPTLEVLRELFRERSPVPGTLHEVGWTTRFRQHRRLAPRFSLGRCFLVGDAAHIHSIIPGQGLNLGMQDAFNLGWKLALVCKGEAPARLLASYHDERRAMARLTLGMTNIFHRSLTLRSRVAQRLRDVMMPRSMAIAAVHDLAAELCAELSHHYRGSPIVGERRPFGSRRGPGPRPGDRAPDVRFAGAAGEERLFPHLWRTRHTLLIFAGLAGARVDAAAIDAVIAAVARDFSRQVAVVLVAGPDADPRATIHDRDGALHRRYGAAAGDLVLVRPDGYVGYRGRSIAAGPLQAHLSAVLLAMPPVA